VRRRAVLASMLSWWLIYYSGEHWIFWKAFGTQSLCETAAGNLRREGISARCAEIRPW
jgi:hypothetical protein